MKVFLSHPMKGLDGEMIAAIRLDMIEFANDILEGEHEIISSYFSTSEYACNSVKNHSLECLGTSICLLADADIIIMGKNWEYARGCQIEHECAIAYGIPIVYM